MFLVSSTLTGSVAPTEYYEGTSGEIIVLGEALKMSGGKLTKSAGSDQIVFICQGTVRENGKIPVLRVTETIEFETISTVSVADTSIGNIVTVDADGMGVTATAEGGVFKISKVNSDNKNTVRGYFI